MCIYLTGKILHFFNLYISYAILGRPHPEIIKNCTMRRTKICILAQAIHDRKEILFGNQEGLKPHTLAERKDGWEEVRQEMIRQGFPNFSQKSWREVRNHDWQYVRRTAVAKFDHNQRSGYEQLKYTEVGHIFIY
jgi:hypothetical protein